VGGVTSLVGVRTEKQKNFARIYYLVGADMAHHDAEIYQSVIWWIDPDLLKIFSIGPASVVFWSLESPLSMQRAKHLRRLWDVLPAGVGGW